jgi:hypothetical protein
MSPLILKLVSCKAQATVQGQKVKQQCSKQGYEAGTLVRSAGGNRRTMAATPIRCIATTAFNVHTWVYSWNEDSHLAPDIQELLSTCVVHPGVAASIMTHEGWRKQS